MYIPVLRETVTSSSLAPLVFQSFRSHRVICRVDSTEFPVFVSLNLLLLLFVAGIMVEGPLLHRLAAVHRTLLFGHRFVATSSTGRFADGAAAIDGQVLSHIEVHGKNIFYFFTPGKVEEEGVLEKVGDDAVVVHIHLGMSGSFRMYKFPGPVPREATRLRLYNEELGVEAHLSASVCVHGNIELYRKKIMELGPDPLREDADKERLWASMQKTKKSIGAVLMDQSLVAGIGNIYRAEILFVVGLHPDMLANTVSREAFEFLWEQSVRQMEIGVEVGNIITVLPEDAGKPLSTNSTASQLRYVYNQKACGKCGGVIKVWTMAQRSVYACEACQLPPLSIPTVSKRVMRKATVDVTDSNSAESGGDVDGDVVVSEKKLGLPRKRVAKGGRVSVHQAYKTPQEVPESLVSPDVTEFHERFGEDGRNLEEFGQPMQSTVDDNASIKYSRRARRGTGSNQADQGESLERDMVNGSAIPSKTPRGRRSARLRTQAVAPVDQSSIPLGFRGKLEFPPPRVARLSLQNFPTSVRYGRKWILSIGRPLDDSSCMKFCRAASPVGRFIRPFSCAQPIVTAAAFGIGVLYLRGSIAGVMR